MKELVGKSVEKGSNYVADPSGLRTGNPPDEKMAQVLQDEAVKLEEYVSKVRICTLFGTALAICCYYFSLFIDFLIFLRCRIKFKRRLH